MVWVGLLFSPLALEYRYFSRSRVAQMLLAVPVATLCTLQYKHTIVVRVFYESRAAGCW